MKSKIIFKFLGLQEIYSIIDISRNLGYCTLHVPESDNKKMTMVQIGNNFRKPKFKAG